MESDSDSKSFKKKKKQNKKGLHSVKVMSQKAALHMSKGVDKTVIEQRPSVADPLQEASQSLLSQQELDELDTIALGQIPHPLQTWQTDPQSERTMDTGQKDLLDFLGAGQATAHTPPPPPHPHPRCPPPGGCG